MFVLYINLKSFTNLPKILCVMDILQKLLVENSPSLKTNFSMHNGFLSRKSAR